MAVEIYQDDDATLVESFPIPGFEAGAESTPFTVHVFNAKGDSFEQAVLNALLALYVEHLTTPGLFVRSGFPPVDELWGRFRIVGYDNEGDSSWSVDNTDWIVVGASAALELGDIPANCAVYVEVMFRPPASAAAIPWKLGLGVLKDEFSIAAAPGLSEVDRGILPLVGDAGATEILLGGALSESGTPDEFVQAAAVQYVGAGRLAGEIAGQEELDQNDSAAAALATGQSYKAVLSFGPNGRNVTKGEKATSPTAPSVPAGDRLRGVVTVRYQAGGTSEILDSDIENTGLYGRYYAEAGSGLELKIHRGSAIGGGTKRFATGYQLLALEPSTTNFIFQDATGHFAVADADEAPETTALGCWYEVDTNASNVTAIRDRRKYAGRYRVLSLRGAIPGTPGFIDDLVVQEDELWLEEVLVRVSDNGGGVSGETKFDVKVNGTTIFTDFATEDHRPAIEWNAVDLQASTRFHQVTRLRRGDVVSFVNVTEPSGGTPARGEVSLLCRMP